MIGETTRVFRDKLQQGPVYGVFCKSNDSMVFEVMGCAGFDFTIIDLEHSANSFSTAQNLIRAAENCDACPIVRIPDNSEQSIKRALDAGAGGVQIPHINSRAAALEAVKAARFAPYGERGVCRYVRAAKFGSVSKDEYFKSANQALLILQIEGREGLENIEEIAEVDGVDILFVGPYDLSQSLGLPGEINHPRVIEAISGIIEKVAARGKHLGIYSDNCEQAQKWCGLGVRYLSTSVDMNILYEAARRLKAELTTRPVSLSALDLAGIGDTA